MNVPFTADGEYSLDVNTMDLAGNKNKGITWLGDNVHDFVIDQTLPKVKVTWDNNNVKNGKYYKADRTATIHVTEKNFKQLKINTNGNKSSWNHHGDDHTMTVTFNKDGSYHLSVEERIWQETVFRRLQRKILSLIKQLLRLKELHQQIRQPMQERLFHRL